MDVSVRAPVKYSRSVLLIPMTRRCSVRWSDIESFECFLVKTDSVEQNFVLRDELNHPWRSKHRSKKHVNEPLQRQSKNRKDYK